MKAKRLLLLKLVILFNILLSSGVVAQTENDSKSLEDKIENMKAYKGFFNFYWDEKKGKIWLEINKFGKEFLYVSSLSAGVGSNDIGLDRGQLGGEHVVKFERVGPKVLLIEPNYEYRALTDNIYEQLAVNQAFAQSVLWGFEVSAENEDSVLVDATAFFMNDAHEVSRKLKSKKQGDFKIDNSRSAIYLPNCKNFPKNTELEASLTFTGNPKGQYIRSVTPTSKAVTVRQHHSLVELPDDKFKMRTYDPRAGYYGIEFKDYATPIEKPISKRFIARHRLKKKNPNAKISEPIEPIIYYLDRGAPEPISSALIEGASWWNQAFEAAGYKNAFQVKLLPKDADPMDLRYNVIQWVHRSTRGWSYGSSVRDPRTGEIIKGHVSLGSLRVRQDFLIAEGLLAPYKENKVIPNDMKNMALARLRQLSAHEVGHTLGLLHNFAASSENDASVMDYPHPMVRMDKNGDIQLDNAYDTGIGEWDKVAITYGYQDFPDNIDEMEALNKIIKEYIEEGMVFISDRDARANGGAHPTAHLWDNGQNAVDELNRIMKIRQKIISEFSYDNIKESQPNATLEEVLVPMYMLHRYQLQAASKLLGGLNYTYSIKGDKQLVTKIVNSKVQKDALDALLATISVKALTLPEPLIQKIPPRPPGFSRDRELFKVRTGITFDPMAAAETAASTTLSFVFNSQRAARLIEYKSRNSENIGLVDVIDKVLKSTIPSESKNKGLEKQIELQTGKLAVFHLMNLAANKASSEQVKATSLYKLKVLKDQLEARMSGAQNSDIAHYYYLINKLEHFLKKPTIDISPSLLSPPDGSPIGSDDDSLYFNCGNN